MALMIHRPQKEAQDLSLASPLDELQTSHASSPKVRALSNFSEAVLMFRETKSGGMGKKQIYTHMYMYNYTDIDIKIYIHTYICINIFIGYIHLYTQGHVGSRGLLPKAREVQWKRKSRMNRDLGGFRDVASNGLGNRARAHLN